MGTFQKEASVELILREQFSRYFLDFRYVQNRIDRALWYLNEEPVLSLNAAKGLQILDIACGSMGSDTVERPEFCLLMGSCGAEVFGIDIRPGSEETQGFYTHIQADLVGEVSRGSLVALPQLAGREFDIVNCSRFVDRFSPDPDLEEQLMRLGLPLLTFKEQLREQAGSLVREAGVLSFEDEGYKKVDGVLSRI